MSPARALLLGAIGLITGVINTVAGGGSLLSFPALLALGYSPLVANVTNTAGVFASSAGGALGYRRELAGQVRTWVPLAIVCTIGSLIGGALLLTLPASSFEAAVPVLIATAALLTLVQPWLAKHLRGRGVAEPHEVRAAAPVAPVPGGAGVPDGGAGPEGAAVREAAGQAVPAPRTAGPTDAEAAEPEAEEPAAVAVPLHRRWPLLLGVLLISIYGGYFGAAIGVLLIAVLGLFLPNTLQRNNALKTSLAVVVNTVAAVLFGLAGPVVWSAAAVLAVTTVVGGALGAVIARRLSDRALRLAVVAIGLGAAVYSALR